LTTEGIEDGGAADPSLEYYRTLIKGACWVAAVWAAGAVIQPLAGKDTAFSLAVSLLADAKLTIAITLAGGAATWALVERHLRHKKTEYLQNRVKELELRLDGRRTTSGLTPKGKTNPKDKGH
jgi:hypothetical protein